MSNTIVKEVTLKAPLDRVWRAISDAEQFGEWFRVKLEGPFTLGERTRGHNTWPGYEHLKWEAKVVAIEPMSLFAFEWHPYGVDPDYDYDQEPPTRVEFRLRQTAEGVHLTVEESGFEGVPARRRDEAFRMNSQGWGVQVENVRAYVEA